MKTSWIVSLLAACPGLAYASHEGWQGMGHACGSACPMQHGGGALALLLMAGVATLGHWALRQSGKDQGAVKKAGQIVGWVLTVGGLLGFLIGGWVRMKKLCSARKACAVAQGGMELPPGHPELSPKPGESPRKRRP